MGRVVCMAALFAAAVPGVVAAAPELIGAEQCGTCHKSEYEQWRSTGHATALARLSKVQQRDATCRSCHTSAPNEDNPALAGVQCESCHGAGSLYAPRYVMKDKDLAKLLGLEAVTEESCAPCHSKDTPSVTEFNFKDKLAVVRHKKADAAPATPPATKSKAKSSSN